MTHETILFIMHICSIQTVRMTHLCVLVVVLWAITNLVVC